MSPAQWVAHNRCSTKVNPLSFCLVFLEASPTPMYLYKCHDTDQMGHLHALDEKNEAQRGDTINTDPMKPQEKTTSKMHLTRLLPLEHQLKARGHQAPENLFYFQLTGPILPAISCPGRERPLRTSTTAGK